MKIVTTHHTTILRKQEELKLGCKLEVLLLVLKGEEIVLKSSIAVDL